MAKQTDPATEALALIEWLLEIPADNRATIEVISEKLSMDKSDTNFVEGLGFAYSRIDSLNIFVEQLHVDENEIDAVHVESINTAVSRICWALHPQNSPASWSNVRENIKPEDVMAIRWLKPAARRARPLYVLDDSERAEAISNLEKAIDDAQSNCNLNGWDRQILLGGMQRLIILLKHFSFFGHAETYKQLALTSLNISIKISKDAAAGNDTTIWRSMRSTVTGLLYLFSIVAGPDAALTAIGHYKQAALGKDPWGLTTETKYQSGVVPAAAVGLPNQTNKIPPTNNTGEVQVEALPPTENERKPPTDPSKK